MTKYTEFKENKYIFVQGVTSALILLFRHDFGIASFLIHVIVILLISGRRRINVVSKYLSGFYFITIPVFLLFLYYVPFQDIWADLILYPIIIHPFRNLPFPQIIPPILSITSIGNTFQYIYKILYSYVPMLIIIIFGIYMFSVYRKNHDKKIFFKPYIGHVVLELYSIFLLGQLFNRTDFVHALPTLLLSLILLCFLINYILNRMNRLKSTIILSICIVFLFELFTFDSYTKWTQLIFKKNIDSYMVADRNRAGIVPIDKFQERAIEYIKRNTLKNEYIFVGLNRHDKVFINDVSFYFLSDRLSATKYSIYDPGVITTYSVQTEIINDLLKKNVKNIVLFTYIKNQPEKNMSAISSGVTILDDYIYRNYSPVQIFGPYTILKRI